MMIGKYDASLCNTLLKFLVPEDYISHTPPRAWSETVIKSRCIRRTLIHSVIHTSLPVMVMVEKARLLSVEKKKKKTKSGGRKRGNQ
jgi:hypothetical protein